MEKADLWAIQYLKAGYVVGPPKYSTVLKEHIIMSGKEY